MTDSDSPIGSFSATLLLTLSEETPGTPMSLPRLSKRVQQGASVVMRTLSSMGSASLGGKPGPGWVEVTHDGERWLVQLTPAGADVASSLRDTGR